jgi:hypothetical protein
MFPTFAVFAVAVVPVGIRRDVSPIRLLSPPGVWLPLIVLPPVLALLYFGYYLTVWLANQGRYQVSSHSWPEVKSGAGIIATAPPQCVRIGSSTDDGRMRKQCQ